MPGSSIGSVTETDQTQDPQEAAAGPPPQTHEHTAAFRGAVFRDADLNGASFHECDLRDATIRASWVDGLRISGFAGRLGPVLVDGVDVTPYVTAELDRLQPERVALREATTADDFRSAGTAVLALWDDLLGRAATLSDEVRTARVDGEWSLTQTVRHLVLATDTWVSRFVLDEPAPYHPIALPPDDFPRADAAAVGIDLAAEPSWAEVVEVWEGRRERIATVLADLTDAGLDEPRTAELPTPAWGTETHLVRDCVTTVLTELSEHHRYATRDLAALEEAGAGTKDG